MEDDQLKQLVGWAGTGFSFVMYGLSLPVLLDIFRRGDTRSYSFYPYLGQFANTFAWVIYGIHRGVVQYIENFVTNFTGMVLASTSLAVFVFYGTGRRSIAAGIGTLVFLALASTVVSGEWWGWVTLVCNLLMYIAPLRVVRRVWRSRSVDSMPLSVAGAGFIGAVPWFVYGVLLGDPVCWAPNAIGVVLSTLQLLLYTVTVFVRGGEPLLHHAAVPLANANYVSFIVSGPRSASWAGPPTEFPDTIEHTNTF